MRNDTRTCTKCNVAKPATRDFFYVHLTNTVGLTSWCKDCMKAHSKAQGRRIAAPLDDGEILALEYLRKNGIPSTAGKNVKTEAWADVVVWGCLIVEVKYSAGRIWHFTFGSTIRNKGNVPDIIMLIGLDETNTNRFFILDALHPVFFHDTGERKQGIGFTRIGKKSGLKSVIFSYENNFALIEQKRLAYSQCLIEAAHK